MCTQMFTELSKGCPGPGRRHHRVSFAPVGRMGPTLTTSAARTSLISEMGRILPGRTEQKQCGSSVQALRLARASPQSVLPINWPRE